MRPKTKNLKLTPIHFQDPKSSRNAGVLFCSAELIVHERTRLYMDASFRQHSQSRRTPQYPVSSMRVQQMRMNSKAIEVTEFGLRLRARMSMHGSHYCVRMAELSPKTTTALVGQTPEFRRLVCWSCPPTIGISCSSRH